jgi:hypothetical protein
MATKDQTRTKKIRAKTPVTVGGYYWTLGPFVIGSEKARALVQDARDAEALAALRRVRGQAKLIKLAGAEALVLSGQVPVRWYQLGDRAGVLVKMASSQVGPKVQEALSVDPWVVDEKAWRRLASFTLDGAATGARVLFDAVAKDPRKPSGSDKRTVPVTLRPGKYVVERASYGERYLQVVLVRVRPHDEIPTPLEGHVTAAAPTLPPELVLRPETQKLARKAPFVSSEGGPILAIPNALLASWSGVYDAEGTYSYGTKKTDYDRACRAKAHTAIAVDGGQALVLEGPDSHALVALPDGTIVIPHWIGADDGAHVLEAALSAPASFWKKEKGTFTITGDELALIDSGADGRKVRPRAVVRVKPGRYGIESMKEYDGPIHVGKATHDLMATALRLRPT